MENNSKDGSNEDLQHMLNSFRIPELQTLLLSCGHSKCGRKTQLYLRAMNLLKCHDTRDRCQDRIKELYYQQHHPSPHGHSSYSSQPYVSASYANSIDQEPTYLNRGFQKNTASYSAPMSNTTNNIYYTNNIMLSEPPSTYNSSLQSHRSSAVAPSSKSVHRVTARMPIHPDVQFITMPFFDLIDVLVKPTSLVQKSATGIQALDMKYYFTPMQTKLIQNSRAYNMKSGIDYGVQVHLRFCLAETSCVQEDKYPPKIKVSVNCRPIPIPGMPPPTAQKQEPRKPHRSIKLTSFSKHSPLETNIVQVQWEPSDVGERFACCVELVKTVASPTLIDKLRKKPVRSQEQTIAFIKEKLQEGADNEIALTSWKVSLCCPIGMNRMALPCRANTCNHLQCFDGSNYLQMMENKPTWMCPVCDQKAHYDQLFVDGMFLNINKQCTDCDEIIFFQDGTWKSLSDVEDEKAALQQEASASPAKPPSLPPPLVQAAQQASSEQSWSIMDFRGSTSTSQQLPTTTSAGMSTLDHHFPSSSPSPNKSLPSPPCSLVSSMPKEAIPEEEEAEVIIIDDSDSDASNDGSMNRAPGSHQMQSNTENPPEPSFHPFHDPTLKDLEFYNSLPRADRIAAAQYLQETGLLDQLNGNSFAEPSLESPPSVIDISDE